MNGELHILMHLFQLFYFSLVTLRPYFSELLTAYIPKLEFTKNEAEEDLRGGGKQQHYALLVRGGERQILRSQRSTMKSPKLSIGFNPSFCSNQLFYLNIPSFHIYQQTQGKLVQLYQSGRRLYYQNQLML